ncbi:MAG: adenosine kinase [Candidatus Eremiobacteraeota bacterium]|nr:adenosine kinase [Candidatus Eremiobacteraeota bacterium]
MAAARYDVVGIGNAIVDVIATADEAFLAAHGMTKGAMMLVDEARARAIYETMGATITTSGGSAGNTIAGLASFGARAAYIGKVRDDVFGQAFRHDITALGVDFPTPAAVDGPATACCLILVTRDSERTMNTYLGACVTLGPGDVDEALVRDAEILYLEGYLYDEPLAKQAFVRAAEIAHGTGRRVALTLSDPFCVERHRADFLKLIEGHVDILFANEHEAAMLFEDGDREQWYARLRVMTQLAIVTCSAAGSVIVAPDEEIEIAAAPVNRVVDTTGAGDLYAAGFLYGLTRNASLRECGQLGSLAAAEVISHFGARPQRSLRELAAEQAVQAAYGTTHSF